MPIISIYSLYLYIIRYFLLLKHQLRNARRKSSLQEVIIIYCIFTASTHHFLWSCFCHGLFYSEIIRFIIKFKCYKNFLLFLFLIFHYLKSIDFFSFALLIQCSNSDYLFVEKSFVLCFKAVLHHLFGITSFNTFNFVLN